MAAFLITATPFPREARVVSTCARRRRSIPPVCAERRYRLDDELWGAGRGQQAVDPETQYADRVVNETLRLLDMGEDAEAMEEFEQVRKMDMVPTTYTYNKLIAALGRKGMMEKAEEIYKDMISCGVSPDFITLSSLLSRYSETKNIDGMENAYQRMREHGIRPNTMIFRLLMEGYFSVEDYEAADMVHKEMVDMNIEPDIHLFLKIMKLKVITDQPEEVAETFSTLRQRKIQPSYDVYVTLIEAYVKMGRLKKAMDLLKLMKKRGTKPDEYPFSRISRVLAQRGDAYQQDHLFRMLRRFRFAEPSALTYNDLIEAHGKQHGISAAEKKLGEMLSLDIRPDANTLNVFIRLYDEYNEVENIEPMIERLQKYRIAPDRECSKLLVAVNADRNDLAGAEAQLEKLQADGIDVHDEAFAAILRLRCESVGLESAEALFQEWRQTARRPLDSTSPIGVACYNAMLAGYSQHRLGEKVSQLLREMTDRRIRITSTSYAIASYGLIRAGMRDEVFSMLQVLRARHARPNGWLFEVLVRIFCEDGRLVKARRVVAEMDDMGLNYGAKTFVHFVRAFTERRSVDLLLETLAAMERRNVWPDERILKILTAAIKQHPEEFAPVLRALAQALRRKFPGKRPDPESSYIGRNLDPDDAYTYLIANMTSAAEQASRPSPSSAPASAPTEVQAS